MYDDFGFFSKNQTVLFTEKFLREDLVLELELSPCSTSYQKQIDDYMTAINGQWYLKFRIMGKYDQTLSDPAEVEDIAEKSH